MVNDAHTAASFGRSKADLGEDICQISGSENWRQAAPSETAMDPVTLDCCRATR
jgi:hypothetical protein